MQHRYCAGQEQMLALTMAFGSALRTDTPMHHGLCCLFSFANLIMLFEAVNVSTDLQ